MSMPVQWMTWCGDHPDGRIAFLLYEPEGTETFFRTCQMAADSGFAARSGLAMEMGDAPVVTLPGAGVFATEKGLSHLHTGVGGICRKQESPLDAEWLSAAWTRQMIFTGIVPPGTCGACPDGARQRVMAAASDGLVLCGWLPWRGDNPVWHDLARRERERFRRGGMPLDL